MIDLSIISLPFLKWLKQIRNQTSNVKVSNSNFLNNLNTIDNQTIKNSNKDRIKQINRFQNVTEQSAAYIELVFSVYGRQSVWTERQGPVPLLLFSNLMFFNQMKISFSFIFQKDALTSMNTLLPAYDIDGCQAIVVEPVLSSFQTAIIVIIVVFMFLWIAQRIYIHCFKKREYFNLNEIRNNRKLQPSFQG